MVRKLARTWQHRISTFRIGTIHIFLSNMVDSSELVIKLDQFLKWQALVQTGGEAKMLILSGEVLVNGEVETRRGRKLVTGDRVSLYDQTVIVQLNESSF